MTSKRIRRERRRWLAPEVVQTSAMDCGPATLKSLLEGHDIEVSYGRLREACQTDVDGTSIDTIEAVAARLGLPVEQISVPVDHVLLPSAQALPAIAVTRQRDSSLHFVVIWRRHGRWIQVMDPSIGRRWVPARRFLHELYRHEQAVPTSAWLDWARTEDFLAPLRGRLDAIGVTATQATALVRSALADTGWFGLGVLDAATRLVGSMVDAGGIHRGATAAKLLTALIERTHATVAGATTGRERVDIYEVIPPAYWSVTPDASTAPPDEPRLRMSGAVLVRVLSYPTETTQHTPPSSAGDHLTSELVASLKEKTPHPLLSVMNMLRDDGLLAPVALVAAIALAAGAILIETLLFRGLFDLATMLNQPLQRWGAIAALLAFALVLLGIQVPIMTETARIGRHLEIRLRMALLSKLPKLRDSYFHSRPVSDMAERSHSIQSTRNLPALGMQFVQIACELVFTLTGVLWIDARSFGFACVVTIVALGVSASVQPLVNERDLRVRNHAGALYGFYLDALLGLVPIRAHGAAKSISRQYEGLLVEWVRSTQRLLRLSLFSGTLQALACTALAGYAVFDHFLHAGGVTGADLLLVYWMLKLPSTGRALSALALAYPGQRNALLRLLEPLGAPEDAPPGPPDRRQAGAMPADQGRPGTAIEARQVRVIAAGREILRDVDLRIAPGEHVAIVGKSGAGKSTLLGLLLGWHRIAGGQLLVDDRPLEDTGLETLRRRTAWVDPSVQIWNRSFVDNLSYASQEDEVGRVGEIMEASKLRPLLEKLSRGLQHELGEGGGLLSGGEGQRVRLGRALMQRDTGLVLLDEPFRGMDRSQRQALLGDVRRWWSSSTLLCVTHDVGETLQFNRVLVIEDGRIVEDGVPADLASRPTRYRDMLATEAAVRQQMWQGAQWRRLRVHEGRIEEIPS